MRNAFAQKAAIVTVVFDEGGETVFQSVRKI